MIGYEDEICLEEMTCFVLLFLWALNLWRFWGITFTG